MALSFSRPDPSSPAAVGSASFPTNRRGFDQGEVRDFLRMVAAELARLQERERFLESEMRAMQTRGMSAPGRLDEETVTTLLGEEAARVLSTARDAGVQIRDRAEESATRLVKDAAEDAARIRESAMLEAQRIREDAARDAEAEIEMAKQQGRDMVNEAREYREKVLSELSRRRDAARAQIEQLLHGRDRLMNAFERARIATEDVIGSLTDAHDEPEFIVDLSPTTGPVPVVNPDRAPANVFDHESEPEVQDATPVVVVPTAAVYDHEEESDEIIDGPIDDLAAVDDQIVIEVIEQIDAVVDVIDHAIEEIGVEDHAEPEHPVHVASNVVDAHPSVSEPVETDASSHVDEAPTNVVSLFGRQRRPEVPEVIVEADQTAERHLAPVEEQDNGPVEVVVPAVEAVIEPDHGDGATKVDDIFARLREGSTAKVASKAATNVATGAVVEDAPKPVKATKAKPARTAVPFDPARFGQRDEALASVTESMSRKLKRVLADEQNSVMEHLRGKRSSLEMDAIVGTAVDHAQRYATAIVDEAMSAAGAGAKSVKNAGGSSRRVTQKAVTDHAAELLEAGMIAAFRDHVRIAIGEADGDREILSSLLRDVYRQWKIELIDAHVEDIAAAAYNKGGFLSLEPGCRIAWVVDPSTKCCSECDDNTLGGAVTRGEGFPTGHIHPPAHPGCRCLIGPVQD